MSFPIKTNQLQYEVDFKALDEKFDIFMVTTTDRYFKDGSNILDTPLLENNVCAIRFSYGKAFWVLMRKQVRNLELLKSVLEKSDGAEKVTITKQNSEDIYRDALLQLLLNSLGTAESKYLRFNNLTGHLYCFHPKWIKQSKKGEISTVMKVPCLEIGISQQCRLLMNVRTFSNTILRKRMTFGKKQFGEYPQYVMTGKNTLRRKLNSNTGNSFILRQTSNSRTEIPFLDIQNIDKFSESKMGVLVRVLREFNERFDGIAKVKLKENNSYTALDFTSSTAKENDNSIITALSKQLIKIVDCIDDDYSKVFCNDIATLLNEKYDIAVEIGKRISAKHYNIRVIHNKAYYIDAEDPHDEVFPHCAVQHVTLEDFYDCREAAVKTVIHELLIKQDLVSREITLYDWKSLAYQNDWTFAISVDISRTKRYLFMTVHPNGVFEVSEQKLDLFNINEYSEMVDIFDSKSRNEEKVLGLVKNDKGEINIIRETGWHTIPEIEKLHQELADGNTYLRNKEKRTQFLSACLDIKYFTEQKQHYYFVGTIGNGMRTTLNDSCNIRKIESYNDAPVFFEELLPLMNVSFVRNGQLTILPFPFKYLREYVDKYLNN